MTASAPPPAAGPAACGQAEVGKVVSPAEMPPEQLGRRQRAAPEHGSPLSEAEMKRQKSEAVNGVQHAPPAAQPNLKVTGQSDQSAPAGH